jgi:transketolase
VHIHAPSTVSEVDTILRRAVAGAGLHYVRVVGQTNSTSHADPGFHVVRRGAGATVIALGPVLDAALAATEGLDLTVLYAHTVRPFDARGLRAALATPDVVLVEPWLTGTSAHVVVDSLRDLPHRLLSLGVGREELRRYGTPADHIAAHGLDAAGIRRSLDGFLSMSAA